MACDVGPQGCVPAYAGDRAAIDWPLGGEGVSERMTVYAVFADQEAWLGFARIWIRLAGRPQRINGGRIVRARRSSAVVGRRERRRRDCQLGAVQSSAETGRGRLGGVAPLVSVNSHNRRASYGPAPPVVSGPRNSLPNDFKSQLVEVNRWRMRAARALETKLNGISEAVRPGLPSVL